MTDENNSNSAVLSFLKNIFDGKQAFNRLKASSDFVTAVAQAALVRAVDAYIKVRPSQGDGFSQLLSYQHYFLFAFFIFFMFNIYVVMFGFIRRSVGLESADGHLATAMITLVLFAPVALFVNESAQIASAAASGAYSSQSTSK